MSFQRFVDGVVLNLLKNTEHGTADVARIQAMIKKGSFQEIAGEVHKRTPAEISQKQATINSELNKFFLREVPEGADRARITQAMMDAGKNPLPEPLPQPSNRTARAEGGGQSSLLINPRTGKPYTPAEAAEVGRATPAPSAEPPRAASGGGRPPGGGDEPPVNRGGDNSENTLAIKESDRLRAIQDSQHAYFTGWRAALTGARDTFFKEAEFVNSPDLAKRQQAYNALTGNLPDKDGKLSGAILSTGYRVEPGTAGEAAVKAYLSNADQRLKVLREVYPGKSDETLKADYIGDGKPRQAPEIEYIFRTKPGINGTAIENQNLSTVEREAELLKIDPKNQITEGEWQSYTRHLKQGVFELQQKEVVNAIDKARLSGGAVDAAQFTNLRQIMRDPDYLAKNPLDGAALKAQTEGTPRTSNLIEDDLRKGKTIGDVEITSLDVKYNRTDKAIIDSLAMKSVSTDKKTFLKREEVDEFRNKLSQNGLLSATTGRTADVNKHNLAQHLRDGKTITEGDFDALVTKNQTAKRPWLINIPKVGEVEFPRWARTAAVGSFLGYLGVIDIPFAGGEHMDGGAAGVVYRTAGQMSGGKTLFMPDGSLIDADIKAKVSQANAESMAKQSVYAGQAIGQSWAKSFEGQLRGQGPAAPSSSAPAAASGAAGSTEKGMKVLQASYALAELQAGYGLISEGEMTNLANTIATKAKSGDAGVLTSKEYAEVRQDSAYTGLPKPAQQKLDELLAPGLKP